MSRAPDPLVSILCPTYQHAPFIEECVRSLCNQEADFDYEVIVRDDASTDGSAEILRGLQSEFCSLLQLVLEPVNRFPDVDPFDALLDLARGKYVAFCEGDDYWTSTEKLQLCIDRFIEDPTLVLVGHRTEVAVEWEPTNSLTSRIEIGSPSHYGLGELPNCHTSAIVMSAAIVSQAAQTVPSVPCGDLRLKMIAAENGASLVLDKSLSCYREHGGGIWSSARSIDRLKMGRETAIRLLPHSHLTRRNFQKFVMTDSRWLILEYLRAFRIPSALATLIDSCARIRSLGDLATLARPPFFARIARTIGSWRRVRR